MLLVLAGTTFVLRGEGRRWWCACGRYNLWTGDAWSAHTSQHLFDPYSFTHALHGFILCGLLALIFRRISFNWRLCLAVMLESLWEIFENSNFVIQRYRAETAAVGYQGDSVFNSLGDIISCAIGFAIAARLGLRRTLILFFVAEIILLIWIRDSLLLNIIMLLYPSAAIKSWQMGH